MRHCFRTAAVTTAFALAGAGCSKSPDPEPAAAATPAPSEAAAPALPRTPAPEGARTFIVSPADGATVTSPFMVEFGAENITVIAAGDNTPDSGHHHLLIDAPLPEFGLPVPKSDQYVHFGGGQTQTELTLEPGTHTLQLLFGDYLHIPHDPPIYSEVITITVE